MARILRTVLLALLASFVTGIAIGTWIRIQMETPERYFIGSRAPVEGNSDLAFAARAPGDVDNSGTLILDPGHHEEQVG